MQISHLEFLSLLGLLGFAVMAHVTGFLLELSGRVYVCTSHHRGRIFTGLERYLPAPTFFDHTQSEKGIILEKI